MVGDLGHGVESSIFTFCDFNHRGREINRKGLLRADEDHRVIGIKRAYYAVQNLASVFGGAEWMPCQQLQQADDSPFDATAGLDRPPRLFQCSIKFHHEYSQENGGKWSGGGFIDGVTLRNVAVVTDGRKPSVSLHGLDADHSPENIAFEKLSVNGRLVSDASDLALAIDKTCHYQF